jgi:hypothetical protein
MLQKCSLVKLSALAAGILPELHTNSQSRFNALSCGARAKKLSTPGVTT